MSTGSGSGNAGSRCSDLLTCESMAVEETVRCPRCGEAWEEDPLGLLECPACGLEFVIDEDGNPVASGEDKDSDSPGGTCHDVGPPAEIICPHCGAEWEDTAPGHVECPECGQGFEVDEDGTPLEADADGEEARGHERQLSLLESTDEIDDSGEFHGSPVPEFEPLLAAAEPDLYERNAFRVLGVSVEATPREIDRAAQKLKMEARLRGDPSPIAGGAPNSDPTGEDAVRDAVQRLRDPETRLVDEFFWYWPLRAGDSSDDEALAAVLRDDFKKAEEAWRGASADGDGAATHNLAISSHLQLLRLETTTRSEQLSAQLVEWRDTRWPQTYQYWSQLLETEATWDHVRARIRQINDPQLTADVTHRLATTLPLALLLIHARLAVAAAERGKHDDAARLVRAMYASGMGEETAEEASRRALQPQLDRITVLCERANSDTERDPARGGRIAQALISEIQPLLRVVDCLLPVEHTTRNGAHDDVALSALSCVIDCGNRTGSWGPLVEVLAKCLSIAGGELAKDRIRRNLEIARENAEFEQLLGRTAESAWEAPLFNGSLTGVAAGPRSSRKKRAGLGLELLWQVLPVVILILLVGGIAGLSTCGSRNTRSSPTYTYPQPSYPTSKPDQIDDTTIAQEQQIEKLGKEIEAADARLEEMKAEIDTLAGDLKTGREWVYYWYNVVADYERRGNTDSSAYSNAMLQQEKWVDWYNDSLREYRRKINAYNALVETRNNWATELRGLLGLD
jgi:DNA-directed RNA polymerase subunit RPC12/RpoP